MPAESNKLRCLSCGEVHPRHVVEDTLNCVFLGNLEEPPEWAWECPSCGHDELEDWWPCEHCGEREAPEGYDYCAPCTDDLDL